jgi:hypothetical protein
MFDLGHKHSVAHLQLYLSCDEAEQLRDNLNRLLVDPEANMHFHLTTSDGRRDLSCSIITPAKLSSGRYTGDERRLFDE